MLAYMEGNIQTIEDLATLMMQTIASKEDIQEVKDEMKGLATKEGFP